MPFVATAPPACVAPFESVSRHEDSIGRCFDRIFSSDAIRSTLSELQVAGVRYPLRASSIARYIPGKGEFLVDGFSPVFVGQGPTNEKARESWLLAVHAAFQDLVSKRPFEMSVEDKAKWKVLSSRIDLAVYRNKTPVQVRQFGQISMARPFPQQIQWESGERESIHIDQVASPDFITFKAGQPFEAIVARDPVDFHLLRIVHIERRSEPARLSSIEEAELLKSIGSSATLPEADWD